MTTELNTPLPNGLYPDVGYFNGLMIREIAGRSGTDTTTGAGNAERVFQVGKTDSPQEARRALIDGPVLINEYDGLFIRDLSHELLDGTPDQWIFTAAYDSSVPDIGGITIAVETTGSTILQTQSYNQRRFAAPGTIAPDFRGAIDVQDGVAQGVQRIVSTLKLNVRAKIHRAFIPNPLAYADLCSNLTGYTNDRAMSLDQSGYTYAPGELLFLGMTGEVVTNDPQLTFSFLRGRNFVNEQLGPFIINKGAHDYVWFLFDSQKDEDTGLSTRVPRAAYVDQVYGQADLSAMRIGQLPQ